MDAILFIKTFNNSGILAEKVILFPHYDSIGCDCPDCQCDCPDCQCDCPDCQDC